MVDQEEGKFSGVGVAAFFGEFGSGADVAPTSLQQRFGFRPFTYDELIGRRPLTGAYVVPKTFRQPDNLALRAPTELTDGYNKIIVLGVPQNAFREAISAAVQGIDFATAGGQPQQSFASAYRGYLGSQWYAGLTGRQVRGIASSQCQSRCTASAPCRERGCVCNALMSRCV